MRRYGYNKASVFHDYTKGNEKIVFEMFGILATLIASLFRVWKGKK